MEDHYVITGCHGTIAEQKDEAYYDDRSDADDDLEKGRIKFPKNKLYGRQKELKTLESLYDDLAEGCWARRRAIGREEEEEVTRKTRRSLGLGSSNNVDVGDCSGVSSTCTADDDNFNCSQETGIDDSERSEKDDNKSKKSSAKDPSFDHSRVVFLSGYSGIGKSALVHEFVSRTQEKYARIDHLNDDDDRQLQDGGGGEEEKIEEPEQHHLLDNAEEKMTAPLPIMYVKGKYSEQSRAVAPFSAISDALEQLAMDLCQSQNTSAISDNYERNHCSHVGNDVHLNGNGDGAGGSEDQLTLEESERMQRKERQSFLSSIASSFNNNSPSTPSQQEQQLLLDTKRSSHNNSIHSMHSAQSSTQSISESVQKTRHLQQSSVRHSVNQSPLIGPGSERNLVLRGIFPVLEAFLDSCEEGGGGGSSGNININAYITNTNSSTNSNTTAITSSTATTLQKRPNTSDYAMKKSTLAFLSIVCDSLHRPLILFIDDLQWADTPSLEMLQFLLTDKSLTNIFVICAFRSNEVVSEDHPFCEFMKEVEAARAENGMGERRNSTSDSNKSFEKESSSTPQSAIPSLHHMDLYNLSPEAVANFIADCLNKEPDEVADLEAVVYQKTMGNIFNIIQALEELVRKNALYYDMMTFEWQWSVSRVELSNFLSEDVVEMVKGKLKELPLEMQRLLVVMAHIPNALDVRMIQSLMENEGFFAMEKGDGDEGKGEAALTALLKQTSSEGMIAYSAESRTYDLTHDRIREASRDFVTGDERDDILIRMSKVLTSVELSPQTEWCLYVAVDHLNSLSPEKTDRGDLAKLNFRASQVAKSRAATWKENELLREGVKCLESSDIAWKEYEFSLHLYKAAIVSEYSLGRLDEAKTAIKEVLDHAQTMDDKFVGYLHLMLCQCDQTRDYNAAAEEGLGIMKLYGYDIPSCPTKADLVKEEMLLNMALRNRNFSFLVDLPEHEQPILELVNHWARYCLFSSREKLVQIAVWRAVRYAINHGIDRHLPNLLVSLGVVYNKQGKIKKGCALGNVAVLMVEKFQDDKENYASTRFRSYAGLVCQIESFQSCTDCLLRCANDLELVGKVELAYLSQMNYFYSYFASGLPLNSLLEAKFLAAEECAQRSNKHSFLMVFQIQRQFLCNLRRATKLPTEFDGEAFQEKDVLSKLDGSVKTQTLRDSSSHRLQLAVIFWDQECMMSMLDILKTYPLTDIATPRLHSRLCFVGLAAFAMGRAKDDKSMLELGDSCLGYFKKLAKVCSFNAMPVHALMEAMKHPSKSSFETAVKSCMLSGVTHLDALANERYGMFLLENNEGSLAIEYLTRACELYYEWGAYSKVIAMKNDHSCLESVRRKSAADRKNRHTTIVPLSKSGSDVSKDLVESISKTVPARRNRLSRMTIMKSMKSFRKKAFGMAMCIFGFESTWFTAFCGLFCFVAQQ